jgi:peptide deformylase
MALLPIYTYGAPVLRKQAKPVAAATEEIVRLALDMYDTMHKAQGIGLAATQVGSLHRILVVDLDGMEGYEDFRPLTVINPEVVAQEGRWTMEEGCLSIPDVRDEVDRAETITLRYRDAAFDQYELTASGLLARVLLHEIDHLNGVLFIDHLPADRREAHAGQLRKIEKGEVEVGYPIVTAQNQLV